MPRLTVWYLRSALTYLALGLTFGMLMLANKGVPYYPGIWRLLPTHMEFLLMGWTAQLALGVAFWILPRFRTARGNVRLAWLAWALLNVGVLLVGVGPLLGFAGVTILLGRLAEAGAAVVFAIHAWPRIKPPGA
jgi:hypothetical protein